MSEDKFWREINKQMVKRWHACRVESHASSPGIPDVSYCISITGCEGHIELKYGSHNSMPNIRHSQIKWLWDRSQAGGRCFILSKIIWKGKPYYTIHKGDMASRLNLNSNIEYWVEHSLFHSPTEIDYGNLLFILSG